MRSRTRSRLMDVARRDRGPSAAGLVVASHGRSYRVELQGGDEIDCATRGKRSDVACGDRVRVLRSGGGGGVIEAIEPRSNLFYRSDAYRQKLIAANVTQLMIVVAAEPSCHEDLLNRCLAGAEHAGIAAIVALNKSDLPQSRAARAALRPYEALGYCVIMFSATHDLSALSPHLSGRVTLLAGQSGVGKSTLINALAPHAKARVGEISTALRSGRHTTTHAELYRLDAQSAVIDTPGLQEFGLHHLSAADTAQSFVEFRPLLGRCRFRDCAHLREPDCAIARAAEEGRIAPQRLASYRRLMKELRHSPASSQMRSRT